MAGAMMGLMFTVVLVVMSSCIEGQLTNFFYEESCPELFAIVKAEVQKAVIIEKRMAASLVRLHFHDCFVQGCDGSILLDNATGIETEKDAQANVRSARGFEVIDTIKAALEEACPKTVSCADILAIASRDSAYEVGLSHEYPVFFGRRDSLNASVAEANKNLPSPRSVYAELKQNFSVQGLDEHDLIALSGAHTIGRVRCQLVNLFLNDTDSDPAFKDALRKACPQNDTELAMEVLQNLDATSPDVFDNGYYKNLRKRQGIIRSDQTLWSTPGPNVAIVDVFAKSKVAFNIQYAISSINMGNIRPLTGTQGEIRTNCRKRNSDADNSLVTVEKLADSGVVS
ncbi:hypothetical protein M758_5G116800 [Ceratodon purpureus]|nr:hypothetical protein M758_5G116800 [Ceratodon purpureus]